MSIESFSPIERGGGRGLETLEGHSLRVRNEIQMQIMAHVCSPDDGEECFQKWVEENSQKFDEIFRRVSEAEPEMLDRWDDHRSEYTTFFMKELGFE